MAKTLEELIILKRTSLKYLIWRESRLLVLGKRPTNKKIANVIRSHQENNVWSSFMDSLNEDLTRNINVFDWKVGADHYQEKKNVGFTFDACPEKILKRFGIMSFDGRMSDAPIVKVEQGELQGRVVTSPAGRPYYSFQGIPYAKPPLGSLRFKAPQPAEHWEGVRDATAEGNVSAQIDPFIHKEFIGDENCLFLNVYTPNLDGEFLPVMVFIHGGGFRFGSGNSSFYGGDFLVEKDVVLITINYRCGPLGFLCLNTPEVPGNAGLKDMVHALRWITENVGRFGGNSRNITVFGESCGGVATSLLTASPLTKDLISKAIIQSGTALNNWAFQKTPIENAKALSKALGSEAEDIDEILDFLSAVSVREIIEASEKMSPPELFYEKAQNTFAPVVEKEFRDVEAALTEDFMSILTSGRTANVPVMIGTTTLEFSHGTCNDNLRVFIPENLNIDPSSDEAIEITDNIKKLYFKSGNTGVENLPEFYQLLSDKLVNIDTHRYVKYLVQVAKKPIYYYKFDYVGELNICKQLLDGSKSAAHMDELGYIFKNILQKDVEPTSDDVRMREHMLILWTNFAKTGNPTPDESDVNITWLPVTHETLYYLNLGQQLSLNTNPDSEKMTFWEELYNKYFKLWQEPASNAKCGSITEEIALDGNDEDATITNTGENNENIEEVTPNTNEVIPSPEQEPIPTEEEIVQKTEEVTQNTRALNQIDEKIAKIKDATTLPDEKVTSAEPVIETTEESEPEKEPEASPAAVEKIPDDVKPDDVKPDVVPSNDKIEVIDKIEEVDEPKVINGTDDKLVTNGEPKKSPVRASNEIKLVSHTNGNAVDVIRANDPPEDDLPKNIGVNKFVNFFESLGRKN